MSKYRCKKCGYIEESETLDDFYVCSICGSSKNIMVEDNDFKTKLIYIDKDNPGISRTIEKCVDCGICKNICENKAGVCYENKVKDNPACISCGQCILNCPMGAIVPKYEYQKVKEEINNPKKIVVALTSPAVRVSLGEIFGMEAGTNVEGKMISSLRKLGFDYVFDTTFGADLTVMEEASELVEKINNNGKLPQYTSCCPSWVKYAEIYHPEILSNLSTCKSPISMQNTIIKNYFAKLKNIDPNDIITVAITPCTSKKMEIKREEIDDGDFVLTTSELGIFIKEEGIDFNTLENDKFDNLLGRGSGAGVIFGNTGGVSEAVIRTVYYLLTGEKPNGKLLNFENFRGLEEIKEATVKINNLEINVAVVHGLPNLEKLLKLGLNKYHFIEVMNCRGGCIGGGGQPLVPISKQDEICKKRIEGLYSCDIISNVRSSFENSDIIKIYNDYLEYPLSEISKDLLHTTYCDKSYIIKK